MSATFDTLVQTSKQVASTRSRLEKVRLLSECLRATAAEELSIAVSFLSGELTQGKIGVGSATVRKAFQAVGRSATPDADGVTISFVDTAFAEIGTIGGKGGSARRHDAIVDLLTRLSPEGRLFLVRLLVGELRHGALEGVMIDALAAATDIAPKDIRRAVMLTGSTATVAKVAREDGLAGVRQFSVELFRPLQPMLAEPSEDLEQAIAQMGQAALEYKLDGVRLQVHKRGNDVRVFTRHLKEVTAAVPEVIEAVSQFAVAEAIFDGEVLALQPDGRPRPFQTTMRRFGRLHNMDEMQRTLPLDVQFFDCLYADDSLIDQPTVERHQALSDCVPSEFLITRLVTDEPRTAHDFLDSAMHAGHEGIMIKSLEAGYAAGGRGRSWLKLKPAHTLDLVVLAAEWGSGRRKGWLSNLHLGARDAESGQFVMIGKTFKGLTDKLLAWQTEQLLRLETRRDDYTVHVEPKLVVEIAFNEVQRSPHYDSGFALRFARVKRYRDDKAAAEADTIQQVEKIHRG